MKKKYLKFALIFYISFFIIHNIILKIHGYPARYNLGGAEPYTWSEIYYALPQTLLGTFILTVISIIIYIEGDKVREKKKEKERKRIAERNKKKLVRRKRAKKIAEKMNLLKLDANLLNIPAYKDNSGAVHRAYELWWYKKNIFDKALRGK